jgi:acyl-CoA synthetase (AMP-forming)/AMP-acid ligase II
VTTVADAMEAAREELGDREAYVDVATGRRLTFAGWVDAADGVAAELAGRGVRPGDVVAIALPTSIDYAVVCAAALRLGAVATGINTRLGPREVEGIVARCRPAVVVTEDDDLLAAAAVPAPRPPHRGDPSDPAVIIWTSGTTGQPKGAWFDHRNLEAAVRTAGAMTERFDRRNMGLPMAHAGYMAKLWEQLAFGYTNVLTPVPWTAESMLRVLVEERITVGAGVPTQWAKLLEVPGIAEADLSALRICLAATAPAPPELVERMRAVLGCPVVVRYAMTESPSITGTSPDDPPEVQHRTVGRPQAETVVDLVDVVDGVGRVRIAGPCVLRGYWEDPDATAEVLDADGRLTSSDLGRFDDDGNLVLVGRASELYIRGGYNVYPLEVEHVLAEHPAVASVAVVGAPRPVIGEIGVAYVVPVTGAEPPDLATLRSWVAERLADYKAPDELHLVEALPLTPMLKVDKVALASASAPPVPS